MSFFSISSRLFRSSSSACMMAYQLKGFPSRWVNRLLPSGSIYAHTHTRLTALCPVLRGWAGTRKVRPMWIYCSKRQWVAVASVCKCAHRLRQITIANIPPLSFLQAGCPSCCPTNSVKALKATDGVKHNHSILSKASNVFHGLYTFVNLRAWQSFAQPLELCALSRF